MKRHFPYRVLLWVLLLVVLVWGVLAGLTIRRAYGSANEAKSLLVEFRDDNGGSLSGLRPLTGSPDMSKGRRASVKFGEARDTLGSPALAPLKLVPVVGRQLRVVQTLSGSSEKLISSVASTFDDVSRILDEAKSVAPDQRVAARLAAAAEMQSSLESLAGSVDGLGAGEAEGLISSVQNARNEFIRNRDELATSLSDAIAAVTGTRAFLSGPNTYVVLAANNGEMRAGSGMFLQAGPMTIADGEFSIGEFGPTEDMVLPEPGTVLDPELEALWGPLEPTTEWRNINLTPRFEESGRMAIDMWQALGRGEAQGAIAIDINAVKRLLDVVGPVTVESPDGGTASLDSDNVTRYLLLEQYLELSKDRDALGQEERRTHLGEVAKAIFESFNTGELGLAQLLDALVDVGRGRHLMVWSSDPVQQSAWEALGIAGELPADSLLFSLINRGGNKLDQFIDTSASLSSTISGDLRHVSVDLTMHNVTPDGLPSYIVGPNPLSGVGEGDYLGYLAMTVPGGAGNFVVDGSELLAVATDGDTRVVVSKVLMGQGETATVTVHFDLPTSWKSIEVLPSARIPSVEWTFGSKIWTDNRARRIDFG